MQSLAQMRNVIMIGFLIGLTEPMHAQEKLLTRNEVVDALSSDDLASSAQVRERLGELRRVVIDETLQTIIKGNDTSFEGSMHLALQLIGQWRVEEAIPALADRIDFRIDPTTVPRGIRYPPWALYPSVVALREIGGPTVRAVMLQKIQEPGDEALLPLYAFVLAEVEGDEAAQIHLSLAAKKVGNEEAAARCERASQLIAGGIELAFPDQSQKEQQ